MKQIYNSFLFLLIFSNLFSQSNFEKCPVQFKKIHFVYEIKSKFILTEKGVFGDSLLLKEQFPNKEFSSAKHPDDSSKIIKFISYENINEEEKNELVSQIYHTNEIIEGTYNLAKNTTILKIVRDDDKTKKSFSFLNKKQKYFEYKVIINYNQNTKQMHFPLIDYNSKINEIQKEIIYTQKNIGVFEEEKNSKLIRSNVLLNENLSKFITPEEFSNIEFGIEKIENLNQTIELKSIRYD